MGELADQDGTATGPAADATEKAPSSTPPAPDIAGETGAERQDAGRGEVMLYAFGNIEGSIANQFFNILNNVMIVAMHVNPLLIGMLLAIKTLWDSVTDPVMAYITDNTRSRWGRRRPYILVGGVLRIALLVLICLFMPHGGHLTPNSVMEAQKFINEGVTEAGEAQRVALQSAEQIGEAQPKLRAKILAMLAKTPETARGAIQKIDEHLATLREDAAQRQAEVEQRRTALARLEAEHAGQPDAERRLADPRGLVAAAEEKAAKAEELLGKAREARRKAIAAEHVAGHVLAANGRGDPALADRAEAERRAAAAYAAADLEPLEIFVLAKPPPPKKAPAKKGMWASIGEGFKAYLEPKNAEQRPLILYVLVAVLLFTTLTTMQSVPYYALGIELSPSYAGRTQVVTYRSIMDKIAGLAAPWVPVLCFSLFFATAIQGLFWIAVFACVIGIPSTVLMCWYVRERTEIRTVKKRSAGLFRSMWEVANNRHFLKICVLYCFIGTVNGIFAQIGFFLNVYWVMGSALSGAKLGAGIGMVAWGLGFATLPIIQWTCNRFQKHRVLQFAIVWMAIGTALKWVCMNPEHPEYQFILPFFFSIGISSVYTVLPTMMADVTDVDELNHGVRREGMFGAVMAFIMKLIGTFTPILAGAVLVMSGFDPALEYEQAPGTITSMRLMYSLIPAGMLLVALAFLWRYPLTRERVAEIKEELRRRRQAEAAAAPVAG